MVKELIRTSPQIGEDEIITHVQKICNSYEFRTKRILCKLLTYIISEAIAGREERLKGYTIGIEVFDKEEDFDAGQDALVRINIGRLRRALKNYYEKEGRGDKIIIKIPKGCYIPDFLNPSEVITTETRNIYSIKNKESILHSSSVALLGFKNLTGDDGQEYFAQGFAEELSVELTNYEDLIVYDCRPGTYVSFSQSDISSFVKDKKVSYLLDGTINKSNQKITINAKLTDTITSTQIWAHHYEHDINPDTLNEFLVKIAQNIASIVGSELGIISERITREYSYRPKKMNTFSAVLKFYYYSMVLTPESAEDAFLALSKSLEEEPDSGVAMACLGVMHSDSYVFDKPIDPNSYKIFGELAEKAATLDRNSQLVNVILAVKHFIYNEKERFNLLFDKCMKKFSKNALNRGTLAFHSMCFGDWESGKRIMDYVIANNFKYPTYFHAATFLYYYRKGEYNLALLESNKLKIPDLFWSPMLRIAVLGQLNKIKKAKSHISQLLQLKPDFEEKAAFLISRFVKDEELVEHVLAGLRKAGMKV